MNYINYRTYLADPDAVASIERAARRARVEAMHRLLIAPLVRFCGSLLRITTVAIGPTVTIGRRLELQ